MIIFTVRAVWKKLL